MDRITVYTAPEYDVLVGNSALESLPAMLRNLAASGVVVITEPRIRAARGGLLEPLVPGARWLEVDGGEQAKSLPVLHQVYDQLLQPRDLDRDSVILALGGGVIGDLAGFVAATTLRGLRVIQVPTTLLAMVDSSVGGKTAINHPTGKNLIGAFHQPAAVLCDTRMLETLPEREYRSALSEVIKTACILDAEFFAWLESNADALVAAHPAAIEHIVSACVRHKATIVARDPHELIGHRIVLNFGHTLAHVLENQFPDRYLHGEAVAIGIAAAARLSTQHARLGTDNHQRVLKLLRALHLPESPPPELDAATVARVMASDKKRAAASIRFVLLEAIGKARVETLPLDSALARALLGAS